MEFKVPGSPQSKGRPRFSRHGSYITTYTPQTTRDYEKLVLSSWKQQDGKAFEKGVPLKMTIKAHFPIPQSVSKKKQAALKGQPYTGKKDLDNIGKIIADGISGSAYYDDAQITTMIISKDYADIPCVEVLIENEEEQQSG